MQQLFHSFERKAPPGAENRMKNYLFPADILLPDFSKTDGTRWATVACDQYTSEPEYWEAAERLVGDAPSTLRLMLPEARLSEAAVSVPGIQRTMREYLAGGILREHKNCGVYLERTLADGKIRRGLVACIDLNDYDYSAGSASPVRATEKTVAERIPPRLAVRRGAPVEMPHVMLLIDDKENTVLGRFAGRKPDAYEFPLMADSGSVAASFVAADEFAGINGALNVLAAGRDNPIVLAVGDGNHSLATAKAAYEEIRAAVGEEAAANHPARYALVEVVNIYDESLQFEPIYRLVKTEDPQKLIADFAEYLDTENGAAPAQTFTLITENGEGTLSTPIAPYALPVTTLQRFLDDWAGENPSETDYIHGEDSLCKLAQKEGFVGFLFEGMRKEELFPSVETDGSLPRKTFSMGHAADKRFYIECRKIEK